jgi:hypothetical protein
LQICDCEATCSHCEFSHRVSHWLESQED